MYTSVFKKNRLCEYAPIPPIQIYDMNLCIISFASVCVRMFLYRVSIPSSLQADSPGEQVVSQALVVTFFEAFLPGE